MEALMDQRHHKRYSRLSNGGATPCFNACQKGIEEHSELWWPPSEWRKGSHLAPLSGWKGAQLVHLLWPGVLTMLAITKDEDINVGLAFIRTRIGSTSAVGLTDTRTWTIYVYIVPTIWYHIYVWFAPPPRWVEQSYFSVCSLPVMEQMCGGRPLCSSEEELAP